MKLREIKRNWWLGLGAIVAIPVLLGAQNASEGEMVWDVRHMDQVDIGQYWDRYDLAVADGWEPFMSSSAANNNYWSHRIYFRKKVSKAQVQRTIDAKWDSVKSNAVGTFKGQIDGFSATLVVRPDRTYTMTYQKGGPADVKGFPAGSGVVIPGFGTWGFAADAFAPQYGIAYSGAKKTYTLQYGFKDLNLVKQE